MELNMQKQCRSTSQGPLTASGRNYSGAGIKTSVPGTVYQIELLMLFINRGLRARCTFRVATEVASAGAFDDLVFEYETATTNGIIFLQVKFRSNLEKKIREIDLTNIANGDFSVLKYFESYRKIMSKMTKEFKGDVRQFVIYAPVNIDDDVLGNFEEVSPSHEFAENGFLYFDPKVLPRHPKFFKIRKDSPVYKKLVELLEKNIERSTVAEKLGKAIASSNAIIIEEVFKKHRDWLIENVLDGDNITTIDNKYYVRFKETFLKNTGPNDEEVSDFRNVFLRSYLETRQQQVNKEGNVTLKFHENKTAVIQCEAIQEILHILTEKKTKFQVAKTFLTGKFKKLKTDASTKAQIESFFDEFVFATNQPNDEELKGIIKKEIGELMSLMMDKSGWVESRLQSCVLDWLKTKEGRFLTNEDCKAFFDYVQQEFASWSQTSTSLAYVSHIDDCGYTFKTNGNLIGAVRKILTDDDVQILCVCYTNRLLTQIKLWQSRSCNQDFIFGALKKLSLQVGSKLCPIQAFTAISNNHIFLEIDNCSELQENEANLLQKLIEIVGNDTKKRLVVMVAKKQQNACENILVNCIARLTKQKNYMILHDLENSFANLSKESKEKLLKTATIRFQNRKFSLGTLLDVTLMDRLSDNALCELINDNLDFGNAPADVLYETVESYYIERTFALCKFLKTEIVQQPEFHIISDQSATDNQNVGNTANPKTQIIIDNLGDRTMTDKSNILVITKTRDTFYNVCQKYKDRNVHWLIKEDTFYVWKESQGSLSEIRKWLNMNWKVQSNPCNAICEHIDNKIAIVNAVPGMGKSLVLSHLESNTKSLCPDYLCIRTSLVDHWADLDVLDEDDMFSESIKFLYKAARIGSDNRNDDICGNITVLENGDLKLSAGPKATFYELLRISIFCQFYNEGNIVLLLDAFDEISPQYSEKVIMLIQTLKVMKVSKIWITTRPYDLIRELEDKLSTFSYTLEPLSVNEQRQLLLHFWKIKLKVEISLSKLIEFVDFLERTIFKHLNKGNINYISTFMGIPLHITMLAVIEEKRFMEFLTIALDVNDNEVNTQFSIYTIYNEFFKIKFKDILYKETDVDAPKYRSLFEDKKKKTMNDNGQLALLELFEDIPEALVCKDDRERLKEEVMTGEEKTGVVYQIADGKPRFVHRTYAEFFAAHFLADTILNSKGYKSESATNFLYKIITENTWQTSVIFMFFNYEIVSNSKYYTPLFNSALNGNVQKIMEVESVTDVKDDLGRTPFHLLFCSGLVYDEAIDIFEKYSGAMLVTDKLFKWSPLHYAILCHDCNKTLLYPGHQFVTKSPQPQFRDINGRTPLILASQRKCTKRCIYNFIYNFSLEIDAQDNIGKTALHYALSNVNKSQHNPNYKTCLLGCSKFDLIGSYTEHVLDKEGMILDNHFNVDQLTSLRKKLLTDPGLCSLYHNTSHNLSLLATEIADTWDAQINAQDCEGKTALHYAIAEKKWMEVHVLIKQKADITIRDNRGRIPAYFDDSEVLDCEMHETTLFFINSLKPDVMKLLVDTMELSQDVLVQILYRYKNISEYLLRKGLLSANMQDSTGKTGLHHAVIQNNGDSMLFLRKINANPNIKDNVSKMPLQYVTRKTNVEVVIINLLMMGAYFDVVSQEMLDTIGILKSTANLLDSVKRHDLEKIRSVITSEFIRVKVIARTNVGGKTAVHIAAKAGSKDIGRTLLLHGACYNAREFDCDCYECKLRDIVVHYTDKAKSANSNQKVALDMKVTEKGRTLEITTESITEHSTSLEFLVRRCRGRDLMVMLRSSDLNNDLLILGAGRNGLLNFALPMLNRCNCQSDNQRNCTCVSIDENTIVVVEVVVVCFNRKREILSIAD